MATTEFTVDQLQKYFSGRHFHKAYNETKLISEKLLLHANGLYPTKLIEQRRPSESLAVKAYRQLIWVPITKDSIGRVITSLSKIRRSSDWSIRFDKTKIPKSINLEDSLCEYCEKSFPFFTSVTNWAFGVLLKAYITDPNALVCIMPVKDDEMSPTSFIRPFPYIFYSEQVIDYKEDDYAVILSTDKVMYDDVNNRSWGNIIYIITTQSYQRYEQIKSDRTMQLVWEYKHNLGELPCFKTKGVFKKSLDDTFIFESRIDGMAARLDEAVREYSDLQAEIVQNIFSEKWEMVTDECQTCKGRGNIPLTPVGFNNFNQNQFVECTTCHGTGNKPRGPYTTLQIKAPMAGENNLPTPPMGYIQKDTAIVKIQDERIDKHIYKALCAINFQFLEQVPQAQSGIAKEVDRDELNTLVNSIAEDLVAIIDRGIYFTNELRYNIAIPNKALRMEQLPLINVPERFDIISTAVLQQELLNAKNSNVNPIIVNAVEVEYANKKFSADSAVRDKVMLMISLDPLAGVNEDNKMTRLSNGGITKETYIISCNIQEYIQRAIDEKGDAFFTMQLKDQKAMMLQYAQEQVTATSTAAQVLSTTVTG